MKRFTILELIEKIENANKIHDELGIVEKIYLTIHDNGNINGKIYNKGDYLDYIDNFIPEVHELLKYAHFIEVDDNKYELNDIFYTYGDKYRIIFEINIYCY